MTIDNTGERILLEKETPSMIARHFFAYKFAGRYAKGKNILDIACGEGYGSDYLSKTAKYAIGADCDSPAVEYAGSKYIRDNLKFIRQDACKLEFPDSKFDLVCSFQTVEHIPDPGKFLSEIKRVLSGQGILIISTPNIKDSSPKSIRPLNKYHVKEYACQEFEQFLRSYFRRVKIYGLKRVFRHNFFRRLKKSGLLQWLPEPLNPVSKFFASVTPADFLLTDADIDSSLDFIAVCEK